MWKTGQGALKQGQVIAAQAGRVYRMQARCAEEVEDKDYGREYGRTTKLEMCGLEEETVSLWVAFPACIVCGMKVVLCFIIVGIGSTV